MQDDPPDLVPEDDGIRAVATLERAREVQAQIVPCYFRRPLPRTRSQSRAMWSARSA
jgi:hypothetical protein